MGEDMPRDSGNQELQMKEEPDVQITSGMYQLSDQKSVGEGPC